MGITKITSVNRPAISIRNQIAGEDGLSAYQVAVKNGFTGSETAWLNSLKGEQGIQGQKGDKGDKGDSGQPQEISSEDINIIFGIVN